MGHVEETEAMLKCGGRSRSDDVPSRYTASGAALVTPDEARLPVAGVVVGLPAEAHGLALRPLELERARVKPGELRHLPSEWSWKGYG